MSIAPTLHRYLTAENIQYEAISHDPTMSSARTAEARRISGGSFGQGNRAAAQCRLYARRPSSVASPSPFVLKGKTSPATHVRDIMDGTSWKDTSSLHSQNNPLTNVWPS
jgi:hypothetical protein